MLRNVHGLSFVHRAIWFKDGDHNTRYFHSKEDQRRKSNSIKKMTNNEGKLVERSGLLRENLH